MMEGIADAAGTAAGASLVVDEVGKGKTAGPAGTDGCCCWYNSVEDDDEE